MATTQKVDGINPTHYKGLKGLFVYNEETKTYEPAQVIDVIDAMAFQYKGPGVTHLGNIIKYSLRLGKKAADASYQSSQDEKNLEEAEKIEWYSSRLVKCIKRGY